MNNGIRSDSSTHTQNRWFSAEVVEDNRPSIKQRILQKLSKSFGQVAKVFRRTRTETLTLRNRTAITDGRSIFNQEAVSKCATTCKLLKESVLDDFTIKTKDGEIYTKSRLLADRGMMFKGMLRSTWKESEEHLVDLSRYSRKTIETWLAGIQPSKQSQTILSLNLAEAASIPNSPEVMELKRRYEGLDLAFNKNFAGILSSPAEMVNHCSSEADDHALLLELIDLTFFADSPEVLSYLEYPLLCKIRENPIPFLNRYNEWIHLLLPHAANPTAFAWITAIVFLVVKEADILDDKNTLQELIKVVCKAGETAERKAKERFLNNITPMLLEKMGIPYSKRGQTFTIPIGYMSKFYNKAYKDLLQNLPVSLRLTRESDVQRFKKVWKKHPQSIELCGHFTERMRKNLFAFAKTLSIKLDIANSPVPSSSSVYGIKAWEMFGKIEVKEVPFPLSIQPNSVVSYVPETVNGERLSLRIFLKLCESLSACGFWGLIYENTCDRKVLKKYGDIPVGRAHWVVLTKEPVVRTKNKSYTIQKEMVAELSVRDGAVYKIPNLLDAVICSCMHRIHSMERIIFCGNLLESTRCQETVRKHQTFVENNLLSGCSIGIDGRIPEYMGVALQQKFF